MAVCGNCKYYDDQTKSGSKGYCTYYRKYVYGDEMERGCTRYEQGTGSGSSGCYLTSACVKAKGLPDDCEELTVLRNFRDTYLKGQPSGQSDIEKYYAVAPKIVDAINQKPNSDEIWQKLYNELIVPCVEMIKGNDNQSAYFLYKSTSCNLEKIYC